MFVLKIVVISLTVLNIGFLAAECNSDQFVEFQCKDASCKGEYFGISPLLSSGLQSLSRLLLK